MSLESGGEAEAALAEYAKLGPKSPERLQLGLELAARLIGTGKREQGLKVAAELEASASAQGDALLRLLDFYNLHDEPDRALAVAQRLVRARPRDPDARVALGEQLFQMNREPEAMKEWALLPGLVRPGHAGWARHAEILAEHRRPEAVLSLQKALAAAPREPKYLRLRAILETDDRLPHQALATWQQVFELTRAPEHRILHDEARTRIVDILVGGTLSQFTSRRQAIEKQALLDLDGKDTDLAFEAGLLLAEIYTREEKYAKAVAVHEKLARLRPQDPERLAELALALRRAGRGDAAMDALERMMTLDPKRSADVLAELAEVAFESGDIERVLLAAAHTELDKADSARAHPDRRAVRAPRRARPGVEAVRGAVAARSDQRAGACGWPRSSSRAGDPSAPRRCCARSSRKAGRPRSSSRPADAPSTSRRRAARSRRFSISRSRGRAAIRAPTRAGRCCSTPSIAPALPLSRRGWPAATSPSAPREPARSGARWSRRSRAVRSPVVSAPPSTSAASPCPRPRCRSRAWARSSPRRATPPAPSVPRSSRPAPRPSRPPERSTSPRPCRCSPTCCAPATPRARAGTPPRGRWPAAAPRRPPPSCAGSPRRNTKV
ncbi:hypothetical protein [Nannocystis pusilla]|uniref:tetratricopeptide repeat protein n=1 Tax=Nannocystis pusilla TaxID=889268 RepID=UPI003B7C06F0